MLMLFESDPKASKKMFNSKSLFNEPEVSIDDEDDEKTLMKQYLHTKHLHSQTSTLSAFYMTQQQKESINNSNKTQSLLSAHPYCQSAISSSTDAMSSSMLMTMVQSMPFLFPQLLIPTSNTATNTSSKPIPSPTSKVVSNMHNNQSTNYETMLTNLLIQQQSNMSPNNKITAKPTTIMPTKSNNKFSIDAILNKSSHTVDNGEHVKRPRHQQEDHKQFAALDQLNDNDRLIFNWLNTSTHYINSNTDTITTRKFV